MKKFNFFKTKQQNRRNAMIGAMHGRAKEDMPKGAFGHNFIKEVVTYKEKNCEMVKPKKVVTKVLIKRKYRPFSWKENLEKGQKTIKRKEKK